MDAPTLTLLLLVADTLTTVFVAMFYLAPRVKRTETRIEAKVKTVLAAAAGMPKLPDDLSDEEYGIAVRAHVAEETRAALRAELPSFIDEFAPVLEERFGSQMKDAIPALVKEAAPIIMEALIASGQEFFAAKSNIERAAGKAALAPVGGVDLQALAQDPRIQALAAERGIDLPSLMSNPQIAALTKKPVPTSMLQVLAARIPMLKPLVEIMDTIQQLKGLGSMVGLGGGGAPFSGAPSGTTAGDAEFARLAMRR